MTLIEPDSTATVSTIAGSWYTHNEKNLRAATTVRPPTKVQDPTTVRPLGYVLGNLKTDGFVDDNSRISFGHYLIVISDELYEIFKPSMWSEGLPLSDMLRYIFIIIKLCAFVVTQEYNYALSIVWANDKSMWSSNIWCFADENFKVKHTRFLPMRTSN
nr:serine carboxypeptidase-like 2 [Quercus suber]